MTKPTEPKSPDDKIVSVFFERERENAMLFLYSKFHISREDAEDIVQNAGIALFENVQSGKYHKQENTSLSTYFKSICWRMACKFVTRGGHTQPLPEQPTGYDASQIEYILGLSDSGITEEQKQAMRNLVQDLPSPCEEILWSYYGDDLSMKEIATLIGYKNADSVKSKKSWCLSRLKDRFNKIKSLFYDDK